MLHELNMADVSAERRHNAQLSTPGCLQARVQPAVTTYAYRAQDVPSCSQLGHFGRAPRRLMSVECAREDPRPCASQQHAAVAFHLPPAFSLTMDLPPRQVRLLLLTSAQTVCTSVVRAFQLPKPVGAALLPSEVKHVAGRCVRGSSFAAMTTMGVLSLRPAC